MNNKKGFTLIELLAVIVILGIIMVIAIPMVSGYITRAKRESSIDSIYGYVDAIQKSVFGGDLSMDSYEGNYYATGKVLTREDGFKFNIDGRNIDGITADLTIDSEGKVVESYYIIGEYELYYDGEKATVTGLVSQADVRKIHVEDNVSIDIDETRKMSFTVYPTDLENVIVTWSSSNTDVVTIDNEGYLTPVTGGDAIITVKTSNGISDSTKVNIASVPYNPGETVVKATVFDFISSKKLSISGVYTLELDNGVTIDTEVYVFNDNTEYTSTPVLCDNVVDSKMCIYKYNKDLKINTGVTMTPQVRKKGFSLYVGGTLTNGGFISMTARGAIAVGQDVLLYKNSNATYEMIPAVGGTGGASVGGSQVTKSGIAGTIGTNRRTGGGGSGSALVSSTAGGYSGAGAAGTSYSGGSGGGGVGYYNTTGNHHYGVAGAANGGAGGNAYNQGGGGAGNPGGYANGGTGTGGLLILYANDINNTGSILSNGSNGGPMLQYENNYGGSSGGGTINIFYKKTYSNTGTLSTTGGIAIGISGNYGGAGGSGSITIGSIGTGIFVSN